MLASVEIHEFLKIGIRLLTTSPVFLTSGMPYSCEAGAWALSLASAVQAEADLPLDAVSAMAPKCLWR